MKLKATKKELKEGYNDIVTIGYCDAQYLLQFISPFSYCTRAEGWACDNYDIDGVLVSTGYAPIQGKHFDCDTLSLYEAKAMAIARRSISYKARARATGRLLKKLIATVIKED